MQFDADSTALVVVDMQNGFCHPDGSLYAPGAGLARGVDGVADRRDGFLAARCVEAPIGVTEAVLHVDDHEGRVVGVRLHTRT